MKARKLFIICNFLLVALFAQAQFLVNNGAEIVISQGSQLIIKGNFHNLLDGNIHNSGAIGITENWINNACTGNLLKNSGGEVRFFGNETQTISGSSKSWFANLLLQNQVHLNTEIAVSTELAFSDFHLTLNNADVCLESSAQITGYSATAYVIAENSGQLKRQVSNAEVFFPLGTASSYFPLSISNSGIADTLGVRVFADVFQNGISGQSLPSIGHCVNNTWVINEQTPGESILNITAGWDENSENEFFDRTHCGLGFYAKQTWNPQSNAQAEGENPYFITRDGITEFSAFAVGDTNSPMASTFSLSIDITAFLEGPFSGANMKTSLNPAHIPTAQPYNISPWNYEGPENVDSIPNTEIVDWVLLEFRDTTEVSLATGQTSIARRAAFLLNDGSIVDLDGFSYVQIPVLQISSGLFVVVHHRNHLAIMSANPLTQSGGIYTYDFTATNSQAWGVDAQKQLGDSVFGMFAADANADGIINLDDKTEWENNAGNQGYKNPDMNLDGQVDNQDKNGYWFFNLGISSSLPQ